MLLIRDTREVYRFKIENKVGKNATAKDVLDYIFGDSVYGGKANFVIREWQEDDKTAFQRLNMFWVIPLTLICAPYQYVSKGQIGWDTKTALGRWLLKITGYLRET